MNTIKELVTKLYLEIYRGKYRWNPNPDLTADEKREIFKRIEDKCFECGRTLVPIG